MIAVMFFLTQSASGQYGNLSFVRFHDNSLSMKVRSIIKLDLIGMKLASDSFSHISLISIADSKYYSQEQNMLFQQRVDRVYDYLVSQFKLDSSKVSVVWRWSERDPSFDPDFLYFKILEYSVGVWFFPAD
jgi:hypothetical protein